MIGLAPSKSPKLPRPRQDRILPYRVMESISLNRILLPDNLSNFRFGPRSTPHLGCLSERIQSFGNRCFSSDGSLFAACSFRGTDIWKYTSGCLRYTPRRVFQPQSKAPSTSPLFYFHRPCRQSWAIPPELSKCGVWMASPSLLALTLTHQSPFLPVGHLNRQLATG